MIPVEVGIPSLRRETYNQEENHVLQCYELDLLEEKRDLTTLRVDSYKRQSERYFNSKEVNVGVLGPNWEGPYIITEVLRLGTYRIKRLNGKLVP